MMKRLLIALISLALTYVASAQTIGNIPLENIDTEYLIVQPHSGNRISFQVDFGQVDEAFSMKEVFLRDKNGKMMEFNSIVDGLNFLYKYGWELKDAYTLTYETTSTLHFILRKKAN